MTVRPLRSRGLLALVWVQALTAFNHNMLRSAILTLVAFGTLSGLGLDAEATIGLVTMLMVAPYVLISLPAGRLADIYSRAALMQVVKAFGIGVFAIAALGLLLGNVPLLLLASLLCGIEAALLGPAKFAILPDLVPGERLVAANGIMSATSTLAILLGLIAGNVLVTSSAGFAVIAWGGLALAAASWTISLMVPRAAAAVPLVERADLKGSLRHLARQPAIALAIVGCSWFWFQGAVSTSLLPLLVAAGDGLPESAASLLLIALMAGIAIGAMGARLWSERKLRPAHVVVLALVLLLPGVDLWLVGGPRSFGELIRVALDLCVLAIGAGFHIVLLSAGLQRNTPNRDRARVMGLNHLANGIGMLLAGAAVGLVGFFDMPLPLAFLLLAVLTTLVALATLPSPLARQDGGAREAV